MSLPKLKNPNAIALFLDFDGTLVEIAERPDAVHVAETTRDTLSRLQRSLDGAIAIITGREIEVIDAMLAPFRCPVAGVHGLTRRDANGGTHAKVASNGFVDRAEQALAPLLAAAPALLLERKSTAIALHYRACPEREPDVLAAMESVAALAEGVNLVRGKMVVEARPAGGDKGTAIGDFLEEPPFAGRTPVFAGDDVTDEDAFRFVNSRGGVSLKIGPGPTAATYRAPDTAGFLAWLDQMSRDLEKGHSIG